MNIKNQKYIIKIITYITILSLSFSQLKAGEIDILMEKLVEKGVLSPVESQIVLDETKHQVAKEVSQGKSYALPKWVQKVNLKQDLRLRYQYEKRDVNADARNRERLRYRLGLSSSVNDRVKVGLGLASGGSDPRSTNQTFQNTFDSPDIRLDLAFAEYTSENGFKIVGGKFKRKPYLWAPTDLMWDGDINPEGTSVNYNKSLNDNTDGFINGGVWVLDENGAAAKADPIMFYGQAGFKSKNDTMDTQLAFTYYGYNAYKGIDPDNSRDSNSRVAGNLLQFDYDSFGISGEIGFKKPFALPINRLAIFGEYINNISDNVVEDTGYAIGFKFGDKKVKKKGQWQGKYIYANLEADAVPDTFPDSDRFGGRTDIKGSEFALSYALMKNIILSADYYIIDRIKAAADTERLFQLDLLLKF